MGLNDQSKTFNYQIYNLMRGLIWPTVNELKHRYIEDKRIMIIISSINHIYFSDVFE